MLVLLILLLSAGSPPPNNQFGAISVCVCVVYSRPRFKSTHTHTHTPSRFCALCCSFLLLCVKSFEGVLLLLCGGPFFFLPSREP